MRAAGFYFGLDWRPLLKFLASKLTAGPCSCPHGSVCTPQHSYFRALCSGVARQDPCPREVTLGRTGRRMAEVFFLLCGEGEGGPMCTQPSAFNTPKCPNTDAAMLAQ